MIYRVLFLFVFFLGARGYANRNPQISVLALVSGKAVTDRDVVVDAFIEQSSQSKSGSFELSADQLSQGLQRVVTQMIIFEEVKTFGGESVPPESVERELTQLRRRVGAKIWSQFTNRFGLNDSDVREKILQKMVVKQSLSQKVKSAAKPEEAKKAIEDWLSQLRLRYKVQILKMSS